MYKNVRQGFVRDFRQVGQPTAPSARSTNDLRLRTSCVLALQNRFMYIVVHLQSETVGKCETVDECETVRVLRTAETDMRGAWRVFVFGLKALVFARQLLKD